LNQPCRSSHQHRGRHSHGEEEEEEAEQSEVMTYGAASYWGCVISNFEFAESTRSAKRLNGVQPLFFWIVTDLANQA
jgi:hypothetical protein